jgi:hypothetical protein
VHTEPGTLTANSFLNRRSVVRIHSGAPFLVSKSKTGDFGKRCLGGGYFVAASRMSLEPTKFMWRMGFRKGRDPVCVTVSELRESRP